jgi:hypothetical protein
MNQNDVSEKTVQVTLIGDVCKGAAKCVDGLEREHSSY